MKPNYILTVYLLLLLTIMTASSIQAFPFINLTVNCRPGTYECLSSSYSLTKCITMDKYCDGNSDCPMNDDEESSLCDTLRHMRLEIEELKESLSKNRSGIENDFSGTGFMFSVNNMIIDGGSNVKMFNQNSDNNVPDPVPNQIEAETNKAN